jgi:hypothetical protein
MMGRRAWWVTLGLLLSCGDSSVDPPDPSDNAGTISLQLAGAQVDLSAVSIRLVGDGLDSSSVAFAAGDVHLLWVSGDTLGAALFGSLGDGRLLTIAAADVGDLSAFSAVVLEAVGSDNTLLPTGSLRVTVSRP